MVVWKEDIEIWTPNMHGNLTPAPLLQGQKNHAIWVPPFEVNASEPSKRSSKKQGEDGQKNGEVESRKTHRKH